MARVDMGILKLQYEILNVSIKTLAAEIQVPAELLQNDADNLGWKQLWPDAPPLPPPVPFDTDADSITDLQRAEARAEAIALETEQYIDNARRRLKIFSLAKETMLAARYLALEVDLLDSARLAAATANISAQALKQLSGLYKDLAAGNTVAASAAISFGTDDNGMPTAIIRDLSGQGR